MTESKLVYWFDEVDSSSNELVGKKGANLGEMTKLGMPIVPGYVVSIESFRRFMTETGVGDKIAKYGDSLGKLTNVDQGEEAGRTIRSWIMETEAPDYLKEEIGSYYDALCEKTGIPDVRVSTRSGGPTSRPGMFDTYLNVSGRENVIQHVKKVWASVYTGRAIWYRQAHDVPFASDVLGVVVMKLVDARSAGIIFTADPVTGDRSRIIVDSSWGMGEGVVGARVEVDRFIVDKETLNVVDKVIGKKVMRIACGEHLIEERAVPPELQEIPCLSDEELREVARIARSMEVTLGEPQDMEWALDGEIAFPKNVFFFQTRPEKFATNKETTAIDRLADIMAKRATR